MPIKVGDPAKDFKLYDQRWKRVSLSGFKGKKVLLSFHPLAWTSVCSKQMVSLEANHDRFDKLCTVPLGLSVDSPLASLLGRNPWA
jgi:peroxiredoxin